MMNLIFTGKGGTGNAGTDNSFDPCKSFYQNYAKGKGLSYLASFATVTTNYVMRWFLQWSTKKEYYNSVDREKGSVIAKLFAVLYLNMAVVVLLAFGYLKGNDKSTEKLHVLQGDYVDFTSDWYGQVGQFLITTMILEVVSQYVSELPDFLIIRPYKRWRTYPKVKEMSSLNIATQHDLNKLATGPVFDFQGHYAQLLSLLFLGMTYAPGLPIMTPILAATFILFFCLDKLLLCRYYLKPPHLSDGANTVRENALACTEMR